MTLFSIYSNGNQDIILKDEWITIENHIKQMELLKSILEKSMNKNAEKNKRSKNQKTHSWSDTEALERITKTIIYYKNLDNEINTNV